MTVHFECEMTYAGYTNSYRQYRRAVREYSQERLSEQTDFSIANVKPVAQTVLLIQITSSRGRRAKSFQPVLIATTCGCV